MDKFKCLVRLNELYEKEKEKGYEASEEGNLFIDGILEAIYEITHDDELYESKDEVELLKFKLSLLKPSWEDAPEWANFLAMDYDGEWNWFEKEPESDDEQWVVDGGKIECAESLNGWDGTLESRPKGVDKIG